MIAPQESQSGRLLRSFVTRQVWRHMWRPERIVRSEQGCRQWTAKE